MWAWMVRTVATKGNVEALSVVLHTSKTQPTCDTHHRLEWFGVIQINNSVMLYIVIRGL
jgi:hypothetical protein